jgi:hypothetical protein
MERPLRSTLASTVLLGALSAGLATQVAAQADCQLTVEPRQARPGAEFVLRGRGYTPTVLTLQREGVTSVEFPLDLAGADPFAIPISSRDGDEGIWRASVKTADGGCVAQATFVVTLPATDTVGVSPGSRSGGLSPVAYLGLILVVLAAGLAIGRSATEDQSSSP